MPEPPAFELDADSNAQAWLEARPPRQPYVIAYDVHRCCGGGKLCQVHVRVLSQRDRIDGYVPARLVDGTIFLVDPRAAKRLPSRFGLTVRGLGPLKHLDLVLDGDQWGELLYT